MNMGFLPTWVLNYIGCKSYNSNIVSKHCGSVKEKKLSIYSRIQIAEHCCKYRTLSITTVGVIFDLLLGAFASGAYYYVVPRKK